MKYVKACAITTPLVPKASIAKILLAYNTANDINSVTINAIVNFFAKNKYPKMRAEDLNISPSNCQKNNSLTGSNSDVNKIRIIKWRDKKIKMAPATKIGITDKK